MSNVVQFKPKSQLETRTVVDGVMVPTTRYEYLMCVKKRMYDECLYDLYENICAAILDAEYYEQNPHVKEIVDSYYNFNA